MNHQQENDLLKARFTVWLEKLIRNAKIDYMRYIGKSVETISIDEIPENRVPFVKDVYNASKTDEFDFEEERLAKAFYELPLMKQRILTMLFAEGLKPEEISRKLNCSAQYVYNQKLRALKKLRQLLKEGGDEL